MRQFSDPTYQFVRSHSMKITSKRSGGEGGGEGGGGEGGGGGGGGREGERAGALALPLTIRQAQTCLCLRLSQ